MIRDIRWLALAVPALVAAYLYLGPDLSPSEPFADGRRNVESAMMLDAAIPATYNLAAPFRVIRDNKITLARRDEIPVDRPIRVDLTIDGEHVTIYTKLRD